MNNYCKKCNCKLNVKISNCPLCGARTSKDDSGEKILFCEYLKNPYVPKSTMVKNIFIGIFAIAFLILTVICAVFLKRIDVLLYYTVGALFVWFSIFNHIFKENRTKTILNVNAVLIILLSLFILIVFKRIDIFVSFFLPITLCTLLLIEIMIVLISNKFDFYCLNILFNCIIALPVFLLTYFLNYEIIPSIIYVVVASVIFVFGIVFGKNTIKIELNKRLHF